MSKRIVVIEDNAPDVFLLKEALAQAGVACQIETFEDGERARAFIVTCTAPNRPDLFVVDWNIPKLDGVELLGLIRLHPTFADTPIVVWSSLGDPKGIEAFDIKHFFVKPSSLEGFLQIGQVLRSIL
mgnify:CR=1 FL=1